MVLNVLNGTIAVNSKKLFCHVPTTYFDYYLNFNYIKNADIYKATNFMNYCKSSLEIDKYPKKLKRFLEMIGYAVSSVTGADTALFFIGKSNSGKSVILNVIEQVVGEQFTTNLSMNDIGDKYNVKQLENCRLNISREIPSSKVKNLNFFKSICSNERIFGKMKLDYGKSFVPRCKLLFAGNNFPVLGETDGNNDAIYNRITALMFNRSIPKKEFDLCLTDKLLKERDIIFSAAVDTVYDLMERNFKFTKAEDTKVAMKEYKTSQNVLSQFIKERCVISEECKIHTKDFFDAFKKYCRDNCYDYLFDKQSIRSYVTSLPGVKSGRFRKNGSSTLWGFKGIELKPEEK